jgi:hypothetical protein
MDRIPLDYPRSRPLAALRAAPARFAELRFSDSSEICTRTELGTVALPPRGRHCYGRDGWPRLLRSTPLLVGGSRADFHMPHDFCLRLQLVVVVCDGEAHSWQVLDRASAALPITRNLSKHERAGNLRGDERVRCI